MYNICKLKKDRSSRHFLSKNKKSWLSQKSKKMFAKMNDSEADAFIKSRPDDNEYYYLKTKAIK